MTNDRSSDADAPTAPPPGSPVPPNPGDPLTWVKSPINGGITVGPDLPTVPLEEFRPEFIEAFRNTGVLENKWLNSHIPRYLHSLRNMPSGEVLSSAERGRAVALELGTSGVFPLLLTDMFDFERVDFTEFYRRGGAAEAQVRLKGDGRDRLWNSFRVNLEEQPLPVPNDTYDLVLCFEVIEHLEKDPMFMIAEINRVLKPGGLLFLTTPNITCSRNVALILGGFAPHFFMKYDKRPTLYRHNIEYAPDQIGTILHSGGFKVRKLWTRDLFQVGNEAVMQHLRAVGLPTDLRGDNLLVIAEKDSGVRRRHPDEIYF